MALLWSLGVILEFSLELLWNSGPKNVDGAQRWGRSLEGRTNWDCHGITFSTWVSVGSPGVPENCVNVDRILSVGVYTS